MFGIWIILNWRMGYGNRRFKESIGEKFVIFKGFVIFIVFVKECWVSDFKFLFIVIGLCM